jgi:NADH dehydrogenase [ubiquinone] 1 alpha subcomplex assembly factor 6
MSAFLPPSRRILALPRYGARRGNVPFSSQASVSSKSDLDYAIASVRAHDPSGYFPGRLLPDEQMQLAYYAVRNFWVETGLRFGSTARVPPNASPHEHLEWWQRAIDVLFDEKALADLAQEWDHPTLRLLNSLLQYRGVPWKKDRFDEILAGRRKDLDTKQYETLDELTRHAEQSCGSLSELVLDSGGILCETNPVAHEAARKVGICHGLTNALRTSIPVMSTTGRLIVPADLTKKYGVTSPRYLLSALGQGDANCIRALQETVEHIVREARASLKEARDLRETILAEPAGSKAVSVLIPGVASERFLDRLQASHFQLTDRNLRNVGMLEHAICSTYMIAAYIKQTY